MNVLFDSIILHADYFILLFLRVSGLIVSSPIFGRVNVPSRVKILFSVVLTYLFFTLFPQTVSLVYSSLIGYLLLCAAELLMGISLAYITNIFFTLVFTSGQLIDMQIGFGIVNVYDVQNRTQIPMTGNVLNIILLIVFFSVDGHLRLIEIVYLTINKLPIGSVRISPEIGFTALEIFAMSFTLGVMIAIPVIASGVVLEIVFGMMMRAVPQLHMFVVGIPLKIFIGLVMLITILPVFTNFSEKIFSEMFSGIEKMFMAFTGAS